MVFSNINHRVASAILQLANKKLNDKFGMRLFELPDKIRIIVVNKSPEFGSSLKQSSQSYENLAILYLILMDIFVSADDRLSFEEIAKSLKPLDLSEQELKSHLESYVKKLYLQEKRQDLILYSWGPRAMAEVEPEIFFVRFLEMAGSSKENEWPEQKRRIEKLKSLANR